MSVASERESRKKLADQIEAEITSLESVQGNTEKSLAALRKASELLREVPRKQTECELELQLAPQSFPVERGRCSECQRTSSGWEVEWTHCPFCGSRITRAFKESDPRERYARQAIERELANLI